MVGRSSLRLLIVQHGDKERVPRDPGLTDLGRAQSQTAARWLAGMDPAPVALWCSPLQRARETAAPIAESLGLDVTIDVRLRERMNWSGDESIDQFLDDWKRASSDRSYCPRSGDSSLTAAERFVAALGDLADRHPDATAIVVGHGGVTTDALRTLLGDDELRRRSPQLIEDGVPNGAITTLVVDGDGWQVESIAEVEHLA